MCRRSYQKPRVGNKSRRRGRPRKAEASPDVQLALCRDELVELMQESLASFATEMGLRVAAKLLEDEVDRRCGMRYERQENRSLTRYGRQRGVVTLAGQKLPIERPRVRHTDGRGELELETYGLLQRDEAMPEACLRRMVHGVSTRDYERVVDLAAEGFGVKRSSVSRGFVKATAEELKELTERRFDGVRCPVVFIDGHEYAGETRIVALGVTAQGEKRKRKPPEIHQRGNAFFQLW